MVFSALKKLKNLLPRRLTAKFILLFLTISFLLSVVPVQAQTQNTNPSSKPGSYTVTTPEGQSFQITPIPTPSGDNTQVTPIPPGNSTDPQVQEAGINLGSIGDFFGSIGGAFKDFAGCIKNFGGCAAATANNIVEFSWYIVQRAALRQIVGDKGIAAVDCKTQPPAQQLNDPECQSLQTTQGVLEYVNNSSPTEFGLLGIASKTVEVATEMPLPIDSGQYFASINPLQTAHAQTGGYEELENNTVVLEVWKNVRNAAYGLSVAVLVIIGFMIMLRLPINPRMVVTAQSALPRIIIALVLITFSFAIAGLMIDVARLGSSLVHAFFPPFSYSEGLSSLLGMFVAFVIPLATAGFALGGLGGSALGVAAAGVVVLLFVLIMAIIILIVTFMVVFKLLTRLVTFLILTMFAPLFFLGGAIPGWEGLIYNWFKRAFASLAAVIGISLIINLALAVAFSGAGAFDLDFAGGSGTFPGLHAGKLLDIFSWAFAAPFIGLLIYSFATKVPNIIDELFGIKPLGDRVTSGIGAAVGVAGAPGKYIAWRGQALKAEKQVSETGSDFDKRVLNFTQGINPFKKK